ncbi:MAG: hypothetical protein ACXVRG_00870 [Gaiellaceae bacterium]
MRCALALALVLIAAGCGSSGQRFSARVTNPWFPLLPHSSWVYSGVKDGKPSRDVVSITGRTRTIDGARCIAVADKLYLGGKLEERTTDWYTQDRHGNVWYYGENTAELYPSGKVKTTEGSWTAGVNGAEPGIFMYASPKVGQSAWQEYLKGQAADHFQVLRLGAHVSVPYRTTGGALLTKEWTPLEPGVLDHKFYVRGVGTVLEQTVRGGVEVNRLVSFRRGTLPGPATDVYRQGTDTVQRR